MNKQANTTAKKLFHSSTFWTLLIVSVLLAFSGGYATGNLNTDSGEIKQVSQGDDMANMSSPGVYEVPEDVEAPRVTNLEVTKDNKAGWKKALIRRILHLHPKTLAHLTYQTKVTHTYTSMARKSHAYIQITTTLLI